MPWPLSSPLTTVFPKIPWSDLPALLDNESSHERSASAALGPAKWIPRRERWQFNHHFVGYFGITLFFCFAWPRPFLVGKAFMAVAALLEGLKALHPIGAPMFRRYSTTRAARWRRLSAFISTEPLAGKPICIREDLRKSRLSANALKQAL
jgi:hypothetical protein